MLTNLGRPRYYRGRQEFAWEQNFVGGFELMQLARRLFYLQFNSSLLRWLLSYVFQEGRVYPILWGPYRGIRLRYYRVVNYHAILGLWDNDVLAQMLRIVEALWPNRVFHVADLGANLGLISLWFNKICKGDSSIVAFEPAPDTLQMLRDNLSLNSPHRIEVSALACADRQSEQDFYIGNHHHQSSFLREWAWERRPAGQVVRVSTTSLDAFYQHRPHPPDLIKMDIEAGAARALNGMEQITNQHRPLIWIESHTRAEQAAIGEFAARHRYEAYRFNDRRLVEDLQATEPNPKGIWGTLLLYPEEKAWRFSRVLFPNIP